MSAANALDTTALAVDFATPDGTVRALSHGPLRVDAASSVALMGPSGCGKSTLLGVLAGLAVPSEGIVTVGATEISALTERERVRWRRGHVGMVFQVDNLYPHLTVEENIAMSLSIAGSTDLALCDLLQERLGLAALRHRFPDQLSGGQRQRVAVARAVAHRPALILADEPTGALDATSAREVIELLVELHREIAATLIVVTHDPAVAAHTERIERLGRPATMEVVSPCSPM